MGQGRKARAAQETQSSNPDSQEQGKVRRKSIRLKDSAEALNKPEEPAGKRKRGKAGTHEQVTPAKKQHGMQQEDSTGAPALASAPQEPQPEADGAAAAPAEPRKADTPSDSREAQCKGSLALQSTPPGKQQTPCHIETRQFTATLLLPSACRLAMLKGLNDGQC